MTTAIFPGRFQPPHIGHIMTLIDIYPLYDKIIVAVTKFTWWGEKKQVIKPSEIVEILRELLKHMPKYEVILTDEGFNERVQFDDLPKFDVVVTGDKRILERLPPLGIKVDYIPRSNLAGFEISGTILRKSLCWDL